MASRMLGSSLGGRAAAAATSSARAAGVSLTQQMYHAAFTSAVNDGDAAPATGSEEDRKRMAAPLGEKGPLDRAAEKAVGGAAEEVKEAGREAKEVAGDVKESVKETRP